MHFSSFIPFAIVAVAASSVAAYSGDYYSYAARGDYDLALQARDLHIYDLVARQFLTDALVARGAEPKRENYKSQADYSKAWQAWNAQNRKLDHAMQKAVKHAPGGEPQRSQYASKADHEKAWASWNQANRKVDHAAQKAAKKHG
ncbi:hypothetical protein DAEQUDRAFT_736933 [Daedalea quercina L-15889]|uniref:Uncharacterized protein n=1 Tax=Daedalea quercina L-15889 TaxID=1314783 RepID=A0A165RSK7_9APHY|nr:hypothetical protein DAEQUDRAFT_736933 [Daedalea quercina L-15889]